MATCFLDRVNQKCDICGAPITLRRLRFRGTCENVACVIAMQRQRCEAEKKHVALQQQRQARRIAVVKGAAARFLDGPIPEDLVTLHVPACLAALQPLSDDRREIFRLHLKQQIDDALNDSHETSEASNESSESSTKVPIDQITRPEEAPNEFASSACATCQGACCGKGDEHAFLNVDSIRHYLRQKPGSAADDILADYVQRLPEHSYADSCVFHGESGCSLPRGMRATVCNTFSCRPLVTINEFQGKKLFIVALDDQSEVVRTKLVATG